MGKKYVITVDLGGTKILTAVLNEKKEIVKRVKVSTVIENGPDHIVNSIAKAVKKTIKKAKIEEKEVSAVCLGVPGTVNPKTGIIAVAPNLGIKEFNIKEALGKYFKIPVLIENDVNLAALGIKTFEFNDDTNNMLVVFVGTGIGSALLFKGELYRGSSFYAGEIGHIMISGRNIAGGMKGSSFENVASRTAIVKSIRDEISKGRKSIITDIVPEGEKIKSKALAAAMEEGDALVKKHINKASQVIGGVLAGITTLLNIDTIVLGGGVVEAMENHVLPVIKESFDQAVLEEPGKAVKIVPTKLGDDAPLYGGIPLAKEFLKK